MAYFRWWSSASYKGSTGESAICPNDDFHCGIGFPDPGDDSSQNTNIPLIGMTVSRPKHRYDNLAGLPIVEEKFIIHKLSVVSIEHGQLLFPVSGIIRPIDVNNNTAAAFQTREIPINSAVAQSKDSILAQTILKAGDGGLGSQISLQDIFI